MLTKVIHGSATNQIAGLMSAEDKQLLTTISNNYVSTSALGSLMGANSGVATLDASGKIPSSQLPSYVDDVLEYNGLSEFPATGESDKIYIAKDTNITYRWGGSTYIPIGSDLALGETSSSAYRGDRGAAAYAHAVTNKGSAFASGLYKITTNSEGHVTSATAVVKSDITALGIPAQDTTYENKAAAENGTNVSLVTTGEKYIWNNKSNLALGTSSTTAYRGDYGNAAYTHGVTNKGSAFASGLYKITTNAEGHVTAATAVVKADITGLGIPAQDTTYQSLAAAENGTAISLVSTGEKYIWNNKSNSDHTHNYAGSNSVGGAANQVNVTIFNATTQGQINYIAFLSQISGALNVISEKYLYLWHGVENSTLTTVYLNVGKDNIKGGITLRDTSKKHGDILTDTLTADRYYTLPDSTGTIALTSSDITGTAAKATADADGNTISSTYLKLSGGTMTGTLTTAGSDIKLGTPSASSDDSGDLIWLYGNGNEKMRLYSPNTPTGKTGPLFRMFNASGQSLYSGNLPLADGTSATGTWNISITGTAAKATADANGNTISSSYLKLSGGTMTGGILPVGKDSFIAYPSDGCFTTETGSITGYIKIKLPQIKSQTMISFDVDIYNYVDDTSIRYHIAGYPYTDYNWYSSTAYAIGPVTNEYANLTVRFVCDGSADNYITIGETTTVWKYPQIAVHNIVMGFKNMTYSKWASGWTVSIISTAITGAHIKATKTNTNIAYRAKTDADGNIISSTYLKLSGGTLTGAINTANNTWNKIGDDIQIGDINEAGTLGIQGLNGNTSIRFTTYNQTTKTAGGKITWNGSVFTIPNTLVLSNTTDAQGTSEVYPALIVGGTATTAHIQMDCNEIIAKSNGTTATDLYLNADGAAVHFCGTGSATTDYAEVRSAADASSTATGALRVVGGVGIAKKLYVGGYTYINNKLVVNPSYDTTNSYNEGIRVNKGSNGWANVILGGDNGTTSATSADIWLVGRRGVAGSTAGAIGDFTIENNGSNGQGFTVHKSAGGATLYANLIESKSNFTIKNNGTIAAGKFGWFINGLAANMAANSNVIMLIGKANSTKNAGYISFHYQDSANANNFVGLGMYGADNLFIVNGDGKAGLGTTTPSQKLSVIGNVQATAYKITDGAATPVDKCTLQWNTTDQSVDFVFA